MLSKSLSYYRLHITKNIAYHITEVVIFYADKFMVMGSSKNLHVFNFAILLKSRKFDALEIYLFYSNLAHRCSLVKDGYCNWWSVSICLFVFCLFS